LCRALEIKEQNYKKKETRGRDRSERRNKAENFRNGVGIE
jgi:hypothetical protein